MKVTTNHDMALFDCLRCEEYILGPTDTSMLDFTSFLVTDTHSSNQTKHTVTNSDVQHDKQSDKTLKYLEFLRAKKAEYVVQYPNMTKKEIHNMALEAYRLSQQQNKTNESTKTSLVVGRKKYQASNHDVATVSTPKCD